jgi:hypothetical protein
MKFNTRISNVEAVQWNPEMGAVSGVRARPKKHEANPDDWYVKDRLGREKPIQSGDWVLTHPDGSHEKLEDGEFHALYEPLNPVVEKPEPEPEPESESSQDVKNEEEPKRRAGRPRKQS